MSTQPNSGAAAALTSEQENFVEAVRASQRSILLDAVAGSGKTTSLVAAAAALPPSARCLALAFNSKIKEELAKRLPPNVTCLTLNGLGHRALGDYLRRKLILNTRKTGEIVSELCKQYSMNKSWGAIVDLVGKAKSVGLVPASYNNAIALTKDTDAEWENLIIQHDIDLGPQPPANIIAVARKALQQSIIQAMQGIIDFDDQLYIPVCFRARFPQFEVIFVDEAQDLSKLQHEMISLCAKQGARLIVAGDPHQAIYGFRGASASSIRDLTFRFELEEFPLTYSFRCAKAIIRKAQNFVPHIQAAPSAPAGHVEHLGEWSLYDIDLGAAILCRNIAPVVSLGFQFLKKQIPCNMLGGDLGAGLKKISKKFHGTTKEYLVNEILQWEESEIEAAKDNLEKQHRVMDNAEALRAVVIDGDACTATELTENLEYLFSPRTKGVTLSTIHRSKGLEWDTVYWLDPWRCPQKFVLDAVEREPEACAWMLEQENNLQYIAITRAKSRLFLIDKDKLNK